MYLHGLGGEPDKRPYRALLLFGKARKLLSSLSPLRPAGLGGSGRTVSLQAVRG